MSPISKSKQFHSPSLKDKYSLMKHAAASEILPYFEFNIRQCKMGYMELLTRSRDRAVSLSPANITMQVVEDPIRKFLINIGADM